MSKRNRDTNKKAVSNSFRELIDLALDGSPDITKAYDQLRTTYLKEVEFKQDGKPKKQYWKIFPDSVLCVQERPRSHPGERERVRDFYFSTNPAAICFVRNLWFAHQFFSKPIEVERFLTATKPDERSKMFARRFEELKTLAGTYDGWLRAAGRISSEMGKFNPLKTDLLATSQDTSGLPEATTPSLASQGSAAVADLIREVEQRASYQAGSPDDASEKALYFLALGRPDIGEAIAKEVLDENPGHAVALYTNAVLLLDASQRHQKQAFVHDIMHPHDLTPVEAEEQWHADRHADESRLAWEKASRAFLLVLKARQSWPAKFPIKHYELAPENWRHRVDKWLFGQAADRIGVSPSTLNLPSSSEADGALTSLTEIVAEVWTKEGRSMFWPLGADFLSHFIIVAARVHADAARDCLNKLGTALNRQQPDETQRVWRGLWVVFPVAQEPSLAEALLPAVGSPYFCRAVFALKPNAEAAALLQRITQAGLANERDRRMVMRSLSLRTVILNLIRGGAFAEAAQLCREMAESNDWPATETGRTLQACWRYNIVRVFFEASRAALEASDIETAAAQATHALQQAHDTLETIAGEMSLLKFIESDEDGDTEVLGDFLFKQPNIITDAHSADFFIPRAPWDHFRPQPKTRWGDFLTWLKDEGQDVPMLIAYCQWLSGQCGNEGVLLPSCEMLLAKLHSVGRE